MYSFQHLKITSFHFNIYIDICISLILSLFSNIRQNRWFCFKLNWKFFFYRWWWLAAFFLHEDRIFVQDRNFGSVQTDESDMRKNVDGIGSAAARRLVRTNKFETRCVVRLKKLEIRRFVRIHRFENWGFRVGDFGLSSIVTIL